jgi:hypothetical protein
MSHATTEESLEMEEPAGNGSGRGIRTSDRHKPLIMTRKAMPISRFPNVREYKDGIRIKSQAPAEPNAGRVTVMGTGCSQFCSSPRDKAHDDVKCSPN